MRVLKFGGSSVATSEAILKVKSIIEQCEDEKIIVITSALGGVTDALLSIAEQASAGDESYLKGIIELRDRHLKIASEVVTRNKNIILGAVSRNIDDVTNILKGVFLIGDLSSKTNNVIVSYGE